MQLLACSAVELVELLSDRLAANKGGGVFQDKVVSGGRIVMCVLQAGRLGSAAGRTEGGSRSSR